MNCVSRRREILCEYCRTENSHQCEFYREHGITGLPGGLAEFIAVPAVNAIKIDAPLETATAALVEPLGCIIHSSDTVAKSRTRYAVRAETAERRVRSVLICGAGTAGLLFTQYLRNVLGYEGLLFMSDPNERKRQLAKSFGADEVTDPAKFDLVEVVHEHTGGKGVEYLIEASGSGEVFRSMPGLICKQATVLLYGHGHAGTDLFDRAKPNRHRAIDHAPLHIVRGRRESIVNRYSQRQLHKGRRRDLSFTKVNCRGGPPWLPVVESCDA
ncbi:MAG TPA: zinc-binding dehydrogenase, partial [Pyrinomonadaceae bacterium]